MGILDGKKYCFIIDPSQKFNPDWATEGYVPSIVVQGEGFHRPMMGKGVGATPWYWGKTLEQAQSICDQKNESMGISKLEAAEMLAESIGIQNESRRVPVQ